MFFHLTSRFSLVNVKVVVSRVVVAIVIVVGVLLSVVAGCSLLLVSGASLVLSVPGMFSPSSSACGFFVLVSVILFRGSGSHIGFPMVSVRECGTQL